MRFANDMTEEETLAALWKIAQEIVRKYAYHEDAGVAVYCLFCSADNYLSEGAVKHDPSCIVLKARALVAQKEQNE